MQYMLVKQTSISQLSETGLLVQMRFLIADSGGNSYNHITPYMNWRTEYIIISKRA